MARNGSGGIWLVVLAAAAAAGWYFRDAWLPVAEEAPVPTAVEPAPATVAERGPLHPIAPLSMPDREARETQPLPDLGDSDGFFLLETGTIFGADVEALLLRDGIIDRFVATVDSLPRDHVSHKIRPVQSLASNFVVEQDGDALTLSDENYRRYDSLIALIAAADVDEVADMYRRYYPLFQQSYRQLGYPNGYFNDRLIEVIDLLLATPVPAGPLALQRPNVLYEFADPELEALASGQKLLLRLGPAHAATIKGVLRELRQRLASD